MRGERLPDDQSNPLATVEDRVFDQARSAILSGTLAPGSRLLLRQLAEQLDVSPSPVRAALQRLYAEGLVRYVPHRGSIVSPLEYEELEEIQAFRAGIEGLASSLGARSLTETALARMARRLRVIDQVSREGDLTRYLEAEWRFREICFRAANRERLLRSVIGFRQRAERYLFVAFSSLSGIEQSVRFQHELYSACRDRDGRAAREITREALEWTLSVARPRLTSAGPLDEAMKSDPRPGHRSLDTYATA